MIAPRHGAADVARLSLGEHDIQLAGIEALIEVAFTGSIVSALVAEFFFSRSGLGYLIVTAMETYRADLLYAVTLVCGLLGVGNYMLVVWLRKWVLRWQSDLPRGGARA